MGICCVCGRRSSFVCEVDGCVYMLKAPSLAAILSSPPFKRRVRAVFWFNEKAHNETIVSCFTLLAHSKWLVIAYRLIVISLSRFQRVRQIRLLVNWWLKTWRHGLSNGTCWPWTILVMIFHFWWSTIFQCPFDAVSPVLMETVRSLPLPSHSPAANNSRISTMPSSYGQTPAARLPSQPTQGPLPLTHMGR